MAHTPGPWRVDQGFVKAGHEPIAFTATLMNRIDETRDTNESWLSMRERTAVQRKAIKKEEAANTKLLASAPDLLDGLKHAFNLLKQSYPEFEYSPAAIEMSNAIKKATE